MTTIFKTPKTTIMRIETSENGEIILKEVYSGVLLQASNLGENIGICMRDGAFEFNYRGKWYTAKDGVVNERKKVTDTERIEVMEIFELDRDGLGERIVIRTDKPIQAKTFPAIKEAIEKELNQEPTEENKEQSKDWEILKYSIGDISYPADALNWHEKSAASIHSVRRLSDNTVWTVGGKFSNNAAGIYTEGVIESFKVVGDEMRVELVWEKGYYLIQHLEKLPPKPQPLFNWVVFTEDGFGFDTWSKKDWRGDLRSNWDDSVKTFVTASEADEYVLLNKPCLSVQDVMNRLHAYFEKNSVTPAFDNIKLFAKSKSTNH